MNNNIEAPNYLVSILPIEIKEDELDYYYPTKWSYENIGNSNVIQLNIDEIYLLNENILPIINKYNESMIGPYENGKIFDQNIKKKILTEFTSYYSKCKKRNEKKILVELIRLLEFAINNNKTIHFLF